MHVAEAKRQLGTRFHWLCDSIDNDLKHAFGNAPNSEFIIAPDGKIVVARQWSKPSELREDLAGLVGNVTPETTIADVGMRPLEPPTTAPKGIVPRIKLPGSMTALKIKAVSKTDAESFYVKLRAEADQGLLEGDGQLYLGFFLDPLYKVHWNNKADPIVVEIESGSGAKLSETMLEGPQVEAPTDADPREFLLDVSGSPGDLLTINVYYVACDDAETFCKPVKQQYTVTLVRDPDGGNRRSTGTRRRPGSGSRPDGPDSESFTRLQQMLPVFRALDSNRDGKLSAEEIENATTALKRVDRDRDGTLSRSELAPRQPGGTRNQMRR